MKGYDKVRSTLQKAASHCQSGTAPATVPATVPGAVQVSKDGGIHLPPQTKTQTKKSEASKQQGQGPSYYEEEDQAHNTVRNVPDAGVASHREEMSAAKKKAAFLGAGASSSSSSSVFCM
jgi:hypothetical protein